VFFMTDDWLAGAGLMGLSRKHLQSNIYANLARADAVVVVSPTLQVLVGEWAARANPHREPPPVVLIPNGAPAARGKRTPSATRHAVLVGQINARTDLTLLRAVLDASIPITVVGPLTELDRRFHKEWDALCAHPLMEWAGRRSARDVAAFVASASVGLVPYSLSPFNLASSPLKTFEYLAGGLPVVSSALPSSAILAGKAVTVAHTPAEFAAAVGEAVHSAEPDQLERAARQLALENSWHARAQAWRAVLMVPERAH
jgi:teichuronic acid biosynthesis glycosyltransferase TuaH